MINESVNFLQLTFFFGWHAHHERISRDIPCDHRPCPGNAAVSDFDRRYQHGVTSDKDVIAYLGGILLFSIIITGDRARANIDVGPDLGISNI